MSQGRRIAAVLAVAAVAAVGDATMAPALSVGPVDTTTPTSVSTPSVSVPSTTVTVPNVPAPSVTAPAQPAPVPKVTVPPKVSTPSATVPSTTIKTPPKVLSSPPKIPAPPAVKNVTGGGGSSGSSSSGSGSSGRTGGLVAAVKPASGSAGAIVGGAKSGISTQGGGSSGVSPFLGAPPGGPGGGAPSGQGGASGLPSAFSLGFQPGPNGIVLAAGSGGVSAFAAAVASLAGCFYALTPFEQQVLVVRSGIDGRRALSRSAVAALLGTTPAAIAGTERTALGALRSAAQGVGCMPVQARAPATALTAFIGGPFGPIAYLTPGVPGPSREEPGLPQQTNLASSSFADKLATLSDGGQASMSVLVIIAVMLTAALAALLAEARRSVT